MMTFSKKTLLYFRIMFIVVFVLTNLFFPCEAKKSHQPNDSTSAKTGNPIRFEHIAFNVPDPVATVKWYTTNLGMKIMRFDGAPTFTTFIADSGMHMMIEFFHNAGYPLLEPAKMHNMAIHLAFSTPSIVKTQEMLVAAGATIVDSLRKTASGDQVLTLRDPWGLPIQFVERVKPMLEFTGLYPEHFAINVANSREISKWLAKNLGMIILHNGKAPAYGMFIADAGKNMMFEFYQNKNFPMVNFDSVSYQTFHVAFVVHDIQTVKDALVAAGAKVAEDIKKTSSGDDVLMLRTPWGLPIQFVKRVNPMLK
jgi:catechol 2,3-dioxygenase-like lactoylglutathione lyase family enzyme